MLLGILKHRLGKTEAVSWDCLEMVEVVTRLWQFFSNISVLTWPLGTLFKMRILILEVGAGLSFCTPHQLPGDAGAAGP